MTYNLEFVCKYCFKTEVKLALHNRHYKEYELKMLLPTRHSLYDNCSLTVKMEIEERKIILVKTGTFKMYAVLQRV